MNRLRFAALALAFIAATFAANFAPTHAQSDEVLVWTDAARLPGFQSYQKSHPDVKMRIVTVDMGDFPAKVQLFNKSGSGWPDVVFTGGPDQVATLSQPDIAYTADLTPLVSKEIIDGFAKGSLDGCQIGGKLYCLRNDLAQAVLWFDAPRFKEFGYAVPKTWEEYEALGLKLAKEHPGYVIGALGDSGALEVYLYSTDCALTQPVASDVNKVKINTSSANCQKVVKMLDNLVTAGAISKFGPFDPEFAQLAVDGKLLALPAASWFGEFVFKPTYKIAEGRLSAAVPLTWAGESTPRTYGWGGGAYFVSTHAKNVKAAADIAVWMATSPDYQTTAPTFPAYLPAADMWGKKLSADKLYAEDIFPVLRQAANALNPGQGFLRFTARDAISKTLIPAFKDGKPMANVLTAFQTELANQAQTAGYTVVTE